MKIGYIKDTVGNNYLGISIWSTMIYPYIQQLREILGDSTDEYIKYQQDRDHGRNHITVINAADYNRLSKQYGIDKFVNSLEPILSHDFNDIRFMGIGTAERNGNRCYFIVVKSEQLQEVRRKYGLNDFDFHITIGFKYKDVHGVRKNEVMNISDPFLKLLKQKYYNNETFDFVKDIDGYELDNDIRVEPIKIEDTSATFRCGMDYITIVLIDGSFKVVCKWQDSNKIPILSNHLINKIFKNK